MKIVKYTDSDLYYMKLALKVTKALFTNQKALQKIFRKEEIIAETIGDKECLFIPNKATIKAINHAIKTVNQF